MPLAAGLVLVPLLLVLLSDVGSRCLALTRRRCCCCFLSFLPRRFTFRGRRLAVMTFVFVVELLTRVVTSAAAAVAAEEEDVDEPLELAAMLTSSSPTSSDGDTVVELLTSFAAGALKRPGRPIRMRG